MATTDTREDVTVLDVLIKLLGNPEGARQLGQTVGTMTRLGQLTPAEAQSFTGRIADLSTTIEGPDFCTLWSAYRRGQYEGENSR